MELKEYFTFDVPNAKFQPNYKNGIWDGKIKIFNAYSQKLYVGLLSELKKFCRDYNYELLLPEELIYKRSVEPAAITAWLSEQKLMAVGKEITPMPFQIAGLYHALNSKRIVLESPTSSGKSLIMYLIAKWKIDFPDMQHANTKRTLIVVPTTTLVEQLEGDFIEYSQGKIADDVHKIYSGKDKHTDKNIVISTWQSIYKMPKEYLDTFGTVMIDEAHGVKANSLKELLEKHNAIHRIGLTGTMHEPEAHRWVIEGLLGPTIPLISLAELMLKEIVSKLKIECIQINYDKSEKIKRTYIEELDFLTDHPGRNNFLAELAKKLDGNAFYLTSRIRHGKALKEAIEAACPDKVVYLINAKSSAELKDETRKLLETIENGIVIATYQLFSTGISVRNLHHVVAAGPLGKSKTRILQSIGRTLRLHPTKELARFWDIYDDLQKGQYPNSTMQHFLQRMDIYIKQAFDYEFRQVQISAPGQQRGKII